MGDARQIQGKPTASRLHVFINRLPAMVLDNLPRNTQCYPLTSQCERDEGRSLNSSLLPMGESRLVIVCGVPEGVDKSVTPISPGFSAGISAPSRTSGMIPPRKHHKKS